MTSVHHGGLFSCSSAFCTRQNISLSIQDSVLSDSNMSARRFRYVVSNKVFSISLLFIGPRVILKIEHLCCQDLVLAERLLMKHLDAPGRWLAEKHRRMLMNKYCGRYLRDKHLHHYVIYGESVQDRFEHNRRLRNPSTTSVQQALHGLAYCVYGKPDVRRLMFEVFDFEQVQPKAV